MRYELAGYEWTTIKPMSPNRPRGVPTTLPAFSSRQSGCGCVFYESAS